MKKKVILVPVSEGVYRVKKTSNLLDPVSGQFIREAEVRRLLSRSIQVDVEEPEGDVAVAPVIRFTYHGKDRVLEAYSIKRAAGTGNLLLFGQEVGDTQLKCFIIADMHNVHMDGVRFIAITE